MLPILVTVSSLIIVSLSSSNPSFDVVASAFYKQLNGLPLDDADVEALDSIPSMKGPDDWTAVEQAFRDLDGGGDGDLLSAISSLTKSDAKSATDLMTKVYRIPGFIENVEKQLRKLPQKEEFDRIHFDEWVQKQLKLIKIFQLKEEQELDKTQSRVLGKKCQGCNYMHFLEEKNNLGGAHESGWHCNCCHQFFEDHVKRWHCRINHGDLCQNCHD